MKYYKYPKYNIAAVDEILCWSNKQFDNLKKSFWRNFYLETKKEEENYNYTKLAKPKP